MLHLENLYFDTFETVWRHNYRSFASLFASSYNVDDLISFYIYYGNKKEFPTFVKTMRVSSVTPPKTNNNPTMYHIFNLDFVD